MASDPLFPMDMMGGDLLSTESGSKKPEDFLDPEAKGLVNLDSLVTKPKSPGGGCAYIVYTAVVQSARTYYY